MSKEAFESLSFDTASADNFVASAAANKKSPNAWLSNATQGEKIWVKDEASNWVLRDFERVEGTQVVLKNEDGTEETVDVMAEIYQANSDAASDMTRLKHINEATVLHNLSTRNQQQIHEKERTAMYTYMSNILIAINPFDPDLTDPPSEEFELGSGSPTKPHPFGVAEMAYRNMCSKLANSSEAVVPRNQSIVISGESGAGKTVSARIVLAHLTRRASLQAGAVQGLGQKLVDSNPISEAFGNAKTLRNNNSSRFGKFMKLQFTDDGNFALTGAAIETYLLEKSRVVFQTKGERNFHLFYQLLAGVPQAQKAEIGADQTWDQYEYLKMAETDEAKGVDDKADYDLLCRALETQGIDATAQRDLFSLISAVLLLGNVQFKDEDSAEGDIAVPADAASKASLERVASNLGIESSFLRHVVCEHEVVTQGESIIKRKDADGAMHTRNAVGKELYGRLFSWVINTVNIVLLEGPKNLPFIGVLDIFGFECFDHNDFEQLLINYTNEVLQATFNQQVFIAESELYRAEGIEVPPVSFPDNRECVELLSAKKHGIFKILDDEATMPRPSDFRFVANVHKYHQFDPFCPKPHPKRARETFIVRHFAEDVDYTVGSFMNKNSNTIPKSMEEMFSRCRLSKLPGIEKLHIEKNTTKAIHMFRSKAKSVALLFTKQIQELIKMISSTRCSFIKCIKPNFQQEKHVFDTAYVQKQLKCQGIMQTCEVLKSGLPTRVPYEQIVALFREKLPAKVFNKFDGEPPSSFVMTIMWAFSVPPEAYRLGKNMIFFKDGQLDLLEKIMNVDWTEKVDGVTKQEWLVKRITQFLVRRRWRRALAKVQTARLLRDYWNAVSKGRKDAKGKNALLIQRRIRGVLGRKKFQREWEKGVERQKMEAARKKAAAEEARRKAVQLEEEYKLSQAGVVTRASTGADDDEAEAAEAARKRALEEAMQQQVALEREAEKEKLKAEGAFDARQEQLRRVKKRQEQAAINEEADVALKDLIDYEWLLRQACRASAIIPPVHKFGADGSQEAASGDGGSAMANKAKKGRAKFDFPPASIGEKQRGVYQLRLMEAAEKQLTERFASGQRGNFGGIFGIELRAAEKGVTSWMPSSAVVAEKETRQKERAVKREARMKRASQYELKMTEQKQTGDDGYKIHDRAEADGRVMDEVADQQKLAKEMAEDALSRAVAGASSSPRAPQAGGARVVPPPFVPVSGAMPARLSAIEAYVATTKDGATSLGGGGLVGRVAALEGILLVENSGKPGMNVRVANLENLLLEEEEEEEEDETQLDTTSDEYLALQKGASGKNPNKKGVLSSAVGGGAALVDGLTLGLAGAAMTTASNTATDVGTVARSSIVGMRGGHSRASMNTRIGVKKAGQQRSSIVTADMLTQRLQELFDIYADTRIVKVNSTLQALSKSKASVAGAVSKGRQSIMAGSSMAASKTKAGMRSSIAGLSKAGKNAKATLKAGTRRLRGDKKNDEIKEEGDEEEEDKEAGSEEEEDKSKLEYIDYNDESTVTSASLSAAAREAAEAEAETAGGAQQYLTEAKFKRMVKDCNLLNKRVSMEDVELIYTRTMLRRTKDHNFTTFQEAMRKLAVRRQVPYQELVEIALYHHQNTSLRTVGVTKRGYLMKRAIHGGQNWKRRYVSIEQHELRYFVTDEMMVAKGVVALTKDTKVERIEKAALDIWKARALEQEGGADAVAAHLEANKIFEFKLILPDKVVHLRAETAVERESWVMALREDIETMASHLSSELMMLSPLQGVGWRRVFVVCEDKTVSLYPSEYNRMEHEREAIVHMTHDTVIEVDVQPDHKSTVEHCFGIRDGTTNRTLYFCATSTEHYNLWLEHLEAIIAEMAKHQDDGAELEYEVWFGKGGLGLQIVDCQVIAVNTGQEGERRGVTAGSLVLSVNGRRPNSNDELISLLKTAPRPLCIRLRRPREDAVLLQGEHLKAARWGVAQLKCESATCGWINSTLYLRPKSAAAATPALAEGEEAVGSEIAKKQDVEQHNKIVPIGNNAMHLVCFECGLPCYELETDVVTGDSYEEQLRNRGASRAVAKGSEKAKKGMPVIVPTRAPARLASIVPVSGGGTADGALQQLACPEREGYLKIKLGNWKKRYVTIENFALLYSRTKESTTDILGQVQLTFDTHVEETDNPGEGRSKVANCFKIITPDSVVYVIAENAKGLSGWMDVITRAVKLMPKPTKTRNDLHSQMGVTNKQYALFGGWLSLSVHGVMKGFTEEGTAFTDYVVLVSWGPDKNYNEAWIIGQRWSLFQALQDSVKRRLRALDARVRVPEFPSTMEVYSGGFGTTSSKEKRGKYRHDKLQAYLAELMELFGQHSGWLEQIPELDDFFELSKRVPQVKRARAMMNEGSSDGSRVYPMNEAELVAAGSVVQQLWRLLQQTQMDVRDDPSIQQLLRTALSLLPRVKESAKVGPFTEMELLPYAQQYREDYVKTFQIYNDVALMFLVHSLQGRYQQLQALHITA
jgi:myosin heavy subunit